MSMSSKLEQSSPREAKDSLKHRLAREFLKYWANVLYLVFFFGAFAWYRRLVLAEYRITYLHYGAAIVEGLILAKVILLGEALGLGRSPKNKPLIYPVLRKTLIFCVFVGIFAIVEHMVDGMIHGKGLAGGLSTLWSEGKDEILSRCLVTFFAFIPFFAFRELGEFLGEGRLNGLFFRKTAIAGTSPKV
jgi:hypothetical protein